MSKINFIHTADLHLDTPFKGLSDIPKNIFKQIQQSTLFAYDRIINHCVENDVDFLIISGDTFDLECKSITAQMYFLDGLKKLAESEINVYIIMGNHDSYEQYNLNLSWPNNTYFFPPDKVKVFSFYKENKEVARIYGRSYPTKSFKENIVKDYIVSEVEGNRVFNIALLHTNVDGIYKNDSYSPSSLLDLKKSNIDYWALGHIHNAQILAEYNPTIIYPGNPQGRNIKEIGLKHCMLVKVNNNVVTSLTPLQTSLILWDKIYIDVSEINTIDNIINSIEDNIYEKLDILKMPMILRILLTGFSELHSELCQDEKILEITELINDNFNTLTNWVLIEKINLKTKPYRSYEEILKQDNFLADFLKQLEINNDEEQKIDYKEIGSELFKNRKVKKYLSNFNKDEIEEINEQVKNIALNYLLEEDN